ncbi:MAG: hypothetical protein QXD80_00150 [Acidilobaceae archaeon]
MYIKQIALNGLILVLLTAAFAAVFAYYPLDIIAQPTAPGVVFVPGSNAGQPDIGTGNQIEVTIGASQASATIKIHPTYRESYYKDALQVNNKDDNAMNVYIIFYAVTNNLPVGSVVKLLVYEGNTKVKELVITSPPLNTPVFIGTLQVNVIWRFDFYVYIPEGTDITNAIYTAGAKLVYTPSTETPPVV